MWFSRKQDAKPALLAASPSGQVTTKRRGDAAEALARDYLIARGLRLITANFKTPGRGGGEVDLIMSAPDGTLVFVEVRQRSSASHGGAAASITGAKRQRIILAARHYLMRLPRTPPCRFDVVLIQGDAASLDAPQLQWLQGAFDAS
jgi:putative endonuclease